MTGRMSPALFLQQFTELNTYSDLGSYCLVPLLVCLYVTIQSDVWHAPCTGFGQPSTSDTSWPVSSLWYCWSYHPYLVPPEVLWSWWRCTQVDVHSMSERLWPLSSRLQCCLEYPKVRSSDLSFLYSTLQMYCSLWKTAGFCLMHTRMTQILRVCHPAETDELQHRVSDCLDAVSSWMAANHLQLNHEKT